MKLLSKEWKKFFLSRGLDRYTVAKYSTYIDGLYQKDLPVIFEFEHFCKLLGIKNSYLSKMINSPENFYRTFTIPKRTGGTRTINSPYPSLIHCQKWIYKNILLKFPVSSCAHGFVPTKSIFSNAELHLGKKAFLKMDLKDFFPSISINWVMQFFLGCGYPYNVAFYLSALCTYEGKLSQGAVTSPYLSNILLRSLDGRLDKLSKCYNLEYTRYADDIAFSGNYIPHKFIQLVEDIVIDSGLTVNPNKTVMQSENKGRRILTGLSIRGEKLKVPRDFKRNLRQEIFYIRKFGLLSHLSRNKIRNPNYIESLIGKANFWLQAEPDNQEAKQLLMFLSKIKPVS